MEQYKKKHLLCNKSFPQMLFSTDRTVPSSCHTELVERIEHHDMFNINYFNLSFEKVFVSSFQSELKLWRVEDQPLSVQLAAIFKVMQ